MKYILLANIKTQIIQVLVDYLSSPKQEISSKNTSVNIVPSTMKVIKFKPGTINLDYGGGKYEKATEYMKSKGVTNLVFDPFWRKRDYNINVLQTIIKNNGADTVTCNNVLNVIKEPEVRLNVIKNCYKLLKRKGMCYFLTYEGNKSGVGEKTSKGWQENRKTDTYLSEIESVFSNVVLKNGIFRCKK